MLLMGGLGIVMAALGFALADPISRIFVGYNESLTALSVQALRIISFSYLLNGVTTYSSSYFTGLNQGSASLAIAAVKGFIGPLAAVFLLPRVMGPKGLWYATPAAEVLALLTASLFFMWWKKKEASGDLPEPDEEYAS
jgi:Na+-driven multidrug efflux pump